MLGVQRYASPWWFPPIVCLMPESDGRNKLIRHCLLFTLIAIFSSQTVCYAWPPHEQFAKQHFKDNRAAFEQLRDKISATDYLRVSLTPGDDVEIYFRADDEIERSQIDGPSAWADLLKATDTLMAFQFDSDSVGFMADLFWGEENVVGGISFQHFTSGVEDIVICKPEYQNIACGACMAVIDDHWVIAYGWFPRVFSEDKAQAYRANEISSQEYKTYYRDALNQCSDEGDEAMGLDAEN
ncbi:MAG: hypothetical protein AB8G16_06820 [Gammaproteobacteria bacterium]